MPASRGVNPLATSHTVEHLSSVCQHSWSHDKTILYLIDHCFKKYTVLEKCFFNTAKKSNDIWIEICDVKIKTSGTPTTV